MKKLDDLSLLRSSRRCGRRAQKSLCLSPTDPYSGMLTTGNARIHIHTRTHALPPSVHVNTVLHTDIQWFGAITVKDIEIYTKISLHIYYRESDLLEIKMHVLLRHRSIAWIGPEVDMEPWSVLTMALGASGRRSVGSCVSQGWEGFVSLRNRRLVGGGPTGPSGASGFIC